MPQIAQQDYIRIDWGRYLGDNPSEEAKEKLLQAYKNGTIYDVAVYDTSSNYKILESRILGVFVDSHGLVSIAIYETAGAETLVFNIGRI